MLTSRQQYCLHGIGIRAWQPRSVALAATEQAEPELPSHPHRIASAQSQPTQTAATKPSFESPLTRLAERSDRSSLDAPQESTAKVIQDFSLDDWQQIHASIEACQNCELAQSCTRKVPAKGSQQADLMIIGEAPGHEEDRQGKPFVGRAGQLLDRMLQAIDLDPASVYVTNILKCRPPNNRDPKVDEVQACSQFLSAQIKLLQPKVIFSVGRVSAQNLLKNQTPVGRLRGQTFQLDNTNAPLLVTYHPAYLLRNPGEKAKVWQDLKQLRRLLESA